MQITLLRHGEPDLSNWGKVPASAMPDWIDSYNAAGVKNQLPKACQQMLTESIYNYIVCSNLNRSIQSAILMGYPPNKIEALFREAELPAIKIPLLKLTPDHWSIAYRLLWLAGISSNVESLAVFKLRVTLAAEELIQLAKNHGSILFIGHGIFNRFIANALINKGWSGEETANGYKYKDFKYWEYATFSKD